MSLSSFPCETVRYSPGTTHISAFFFSSAWKASGAYFAGVTSGLYASIILPESHFSREKRLQSFLRYFTGCAPDPSGFVPP